MVGTFMFALEITGLDRFASKSTANRPLNGPHIICDHHPFSAMANHSDPFPPISACIVRLLTNPILRIQHNQPMWARVDFGTMRNNSPPNEMEETCAAGQHEYVFTPTSIEVHHCGEMNIRTLCVRRKDILLRIRHKSRAVLHSNWQQTPRSLTRSRRISVQPSGAAQLSTSSSVFD